MYWFDRNLRCRLGSVNFEHYAKYITKWHKNIVTELSFNENFMNLWAKYGNNGIAEYLTRQEMLSCRITVFDSDRLSAKPEDGNFEEWLAAVKWLARIVPDDIKVVRVPSLNVSINGIRYGESSFYKVNNWSGIGGQKPMPPIHPSLLCRKIHQHYYPCIKLKMNPDVYFSKRDLSDDDWNIVQKFEAQHHKNVCVKDDERYDLFASEVDEDQLFIPYSVNRKLPLPILLTGFSFNSYLLICKKTDCIGIFKGS